MQPVIVTKDAKGVPRFEQPSALSYIVWLLVVAFVVWSFQASEMSISRIVGGGIRLFSPEGILARMFPPDLERIDRILWTLLITFQMAVAGALLGLVLSLPLAALAANGVSPNVVVRMMSRGIISLFRTVPELVWALIFVIAVGLGPAAGVLTIAVETIGFAGRFFAEAMEEADKGPREALEAIGASRTGIMFSAVLPEAAPSFVATSLYSLERAVRGSVVLGLVGAGGIGVDLKVAFDLFNYREACTIILLVFVLVVIVEQVSARIRKRII